MNHKDDKCKNLLVLAAGLLQVPIIKKAREMGYYVVAADGNPNAVGLSLADKAVVANITSEDVMLEVARREKIDGVIHPCSEVSMNVMGRINDELHLSGISRATAIRATNKHAMREAFEQGGAPSPKSLCFLDAELAWGAFCTEIDGDAILKPSRNSGSRGIAKISKVICEKQFAELFERAKVESRDKSVMLEQFIEGPEFSVEIIVWQGDVHVLTVTDKKTTEAPYFVELGHNQPSMFPAETVAAIKEAAIMGVKALGLDNCAAHAELKVMDGKPYLMEIGARLGGDFISTELTHLSTGIDMVAAAINVALGIAPCLEPTEPKYGVCIRYFTAQPGKLLSFSGLEPFNNPHIYQMEIYQKPGDIIPEVRSSLDRSGHVIVTHDTVQKAIELADKIVKSVEFRVESL